jgi:hypothetical protein
MKGILGIACVVSVAAASAASATVFDGHTVGLAFELHSSVVNSVGTHTQVAPYDFSPFHVSNNTFTFSFETTFANSPTSFVTIYDSFGTIEDFLMVTSWASPSVSFNPSRVTFGPDWITVDLTGLVFNADAQLVLTVNGRAVPEPASWALMLGGLGLVGGAMQRRKVSVTFA